MAEPSNGKKRNVREFLGEEGIGSRRRRIGGGKIAWVVGWESPERRNQFERKELAVPVLPLRPNRCQAKAPPDLVNDQKEPALPLKPKIGRTNSVVRLAKLHTKRSIQNIRQLFSPTNSVLWRPDYKEPIEPTRQESHENEESWDVYMNQLPSSAYSVDSLMYDEDARYVIKSEAVSGLGSESDMEIEMMNTKNDEHEETKYKLEDMKYNSNLELINQLPHLHISTPSSLPPQKSSIIRPTERHISRHYLRDSPSTTLLINNQQRHISFTASPDILSLAPSSTTSTCNHATPSPNINRQEMTTLYTEHYAPYMVGNVAQIAPLSYTELNWQSALHSILTSPSLSPAILDTVQARLSGINLRDTDGTVIPNNIPSLQDVGLVPNFSYPIEAAAFYDREIGDEADDRQGDDRSSTYSFQNAGIEEGEKLTNGITPENEKVERLTNGVHNHIPPESRIDSPIYSPPTPSLTPSPPPQGRQRTRASFESHIHPTQVVQIQKMQKELEALRKRNEQLEEALPQLHQRLDSQSLTAKYNLNTIDALKEEVVDLKIALDYGNKALGTCFTREWSLVQAIKDIRDNMGKQTVRKHDTLRKNLLKRPWHKKTKLDENLKTGQLPEGYEWEIFGKGPDPPGSQDIWKHLPNLSSGSQHSPRSQGGQRSDSTMAISKPEIEIVASVAEHNLKMLHDGIHEMMRLVQGCKDRVTFTGIQEVRTPPPGSWRDV
jgi:hypothetical protein